MLTSADIFRAAGPAYVEAHAGRMLPSHRRAMDDIVACRTPALGGSLYRCDDCATNLTAARVPVVAIDSCIR